MSRMRPPGRPSERSCDLELQDAVRSVASKIEGPQCQDLDMILFHTLRRPVRRPADQSVPGKAQKLRERGNMDENLASSLPEAGVRGAHGRGIPAAADDSNKLARSGVKRYLR